MNLKGILVMLTVCVTACSPDVTNINYCNHGESGQTVTTKPVNVIANVGDSNYGTRTVVTDDEVKGNSLKNAVIALGDESGYYDVANMTAGSFTDVSSVVKYGTNRGYVFAEADLTDPYAYDWQYTKSISDGTLTLKPVALDDTYVAPVPVMFWGNYSTVTSKETKTSYTEGATDWLTDEVDAETQSIAISKNIQYATSVFKPVITVEDNITVYTKNGISTTTVSKDDFKFTIQYVYVHSSNSVVYGKDFTYTTSGDATYKYALKANGIFGKSENGSDVFDNWNNNYTNLSILPTQTTSVKVVLVCKPMQNTRNVYMYDASKKQYTAVGTSTFYIFGTIKTDSNNTVTNSGNSLCPKDGSAGVFIPDVRTIAEITLSDFTIKSDNDDTVIINPDKDAVVTKGAFNIDVEYGEMNSTWGQEK